MEVHTAFEQSNDRLRPSDLHVAALLERGVRVLVYVGKNDWGCNWIANDAFTRNLEWSGRDAFNKEEIHTWKIDGNDKGFTRSAQGLTFVVIDGAGHMVSYFDYGQT
jgi:carboxypeptidase C (cathepsin A)